MKDYVYQRSNEDLYNIYLDPNESNFQHMNCRTLINRLNNGDMAALEVLQKIQVISILDSSTYTTPKSVLETIEIYTRSNENIYKDYENSKNISSKTRDCNIFIYRSRHGDKEAHDKLLLIALDELIDSSDSKQASDALSKMSRD